MSTISFDEAIKRSKGKRYLLLGNGFSISLFPKVFSYNSLLSEADFENKNTKEVFNILKTSDFERVIKSLKDTAKIVPIYSENNEKLAEEIKQEADSLKNILVETITKNHPAKISEITDQQLKSAMAFLKNFQGNKIYTLNYDLLLYWTLLSGESGPDKIDDGFRNPDNEFGADYRTFDSPQSPTFWYLHGGLHLFDAGSEVRKYIWSNTGRPIMGQVREALDKELYPLFVAEGSSEEKLEKITHSGYLSKALRSFEAICEQKKADLFILGHSLADNDDHVLEKIVKGTISRVFISLYRPDSDESKSIIKKAEKLRSDRSNKNPLEVVFFDSETAHVWDSKVE
ncbi:MAG: DUF4917 family protein [Oligoflexia bacterium]|nr:DUF4917 family protein [Oligoflexia bacterium]MBF0365335.1 DUF4917 family protein [Oligoflexia bacterium]